MNAVVLDASAAVEMVTRTEAGAQLNRIVPANTSWWVPNGLFDAEVNSVLRRLSLAGTFDDQHIDSARRLSFYDACYVALADVLRAPLVTVDMKLANAPGLSVETIHP